MGVTGYVIYDFVANDVSDRWGSVKVYAIASYDRSDIVGRQIPKVNRNRLTSVRANLEDRVGAGAIENVGAVPLGVLSNPSNLC